MATEREEIEAKLRAKYLEIGARLEKKYGPNSAKVDFAVFLVAALSLADRERRILEQGA